MTIALSAGARPHGAVRAAIFAASLAVAACFGAAVAFAETSDESATATVQTPAVR